MWLVRFAGANGASLLGQTFPLRRQTTYYNCHFFSWCSCSFEDGARMADTTLYEFQQWPLGFLTPAQVLWRPLPPPTLEYTSSTNPVQQVWIRFHPSAQVSVLAALRKSISTVLEREHLDLSEKTAAQKGETRVELRDVREEVCVFEVVGPRSGKVLRGALGELVKDEPREEIKQVRPFRLC